MKRIFALPALLSAAVFAGPLTWDKLVQSAQNDPRYEAAQKRSEATSTGRSTKLWDKLELRYQLDGFSFAKHDFELRMTPKPFGESSADKERADAVRDYEKARFGVERSLLLYDRYERGVSSVSPVIVFHPGSRRSLRSPCYPKGRIRFSPPWNHRCPNPCGFRV